MEQIERNGRSYFFIANKFGHIKSDHRWAIGLRHQNIGHLVDWIVEHPGVVAACGFAPRCQARIGPALIGWIQKFNEPRQSSCLWIQTQHSAESLLQIRLFTHVQRASTVSAHQCAKPKFEKFRVGRRGRQLQGIKSTRLAARDGQIGTTQRSHQDF